MQEEETYNIVAAHGYFGRLIFQYASFNNSRSLHFFLAAWPVIGNFFAALHFKLQLITCLKRRISFRRKFLTNLQKFTNVFEMNFNKTQSQFV
jgi:hypothetical protein